MSLLLRRRALLAPTENTGRLYLYNNGSSPVEFAKTFRTYNNPGTFEYADGYLKFTMANNSSSSNPRRAHCVSQTKVDLTGYSKLCSSYACDYENGNIRLCLWTELSTSLYDLNYVTCSPEVPLKTDSSGILELPLADWQGEYYVGLFLHKNGGLGYSQTIQVPQIWLE
jgi:hypothetical protein